MKIKINGEYQKIKDKKNKKNLKANYKVPNELWVDIYEARILDDLE